jgi:hypothetical protein
MCDRAVKIRCNTLVPSPRTCTMLGEYILHLLIWAWIGRCSTRPNPPHYISMYIVRWKFPTPWCIYQRAPKSSFCHIIEGAEPKADFWLSWVSHPPIHPPFVIVRIRSHLKAMKSHLNIIYSAYSPLLCSYLTDTQNRTPEVIAVWIDKSIDLPYMSVQELKLNCRYSIQQPLPL